MREHDTTGTDATEFWAELHRKEDKRKRDAEILAEMKADGIGGININANDGSNDPAYHPIPENPWVWRWQLCARAMD